METNAVQVRNLRKAYGDRTVVHDVSFDIARGETFAILGPNGAGKTTTVEILEGYRRRTGGEVEVLGVDPGAAGLTVTDDGRGFDPAERTHGFGLEGMRERVAIAGGSLDVSSAVGRGTTLALRLPGTLTDPRRPVGAPAHDTSGAAR